MTHRRPISLCDRETLILQAASAAQCWFVVLAGLALVTLAGCVHYA